MNKFNRTSYLSTRRDAWVEVNLANLEHNIEEIKKFVKKDAKLFAVIKADAYGHGAVMCAPIMLAEGVDMFGVASLDEGIQLRDAGITKPILVLGAVPVWSVDQVAQNDISISVFSDEHVSACKLTYEKTGIKPKVHVKIDTGMNRIGVRPEDAVQYIKNLQQADFVDLKGVFTHFACAEDREKTQLQIDKFYNVVSQIDTKDLLIHCCNTAGIICYDNVPYNMARAGIAIYGLMPDLTPDCKNAPNLKQMMSLKGRITNIHTANNDEGISYSHTFKTKNKTKIATIPIGYADGVSRKLSNKIQGILNGKFVKQIGNITMDQMMFDITDCDAQEGDIITLLGEDGDKFVSIDEWAKILDTINYELTCRLKVRLSRVYTR